MKRLFIAVLCAAACGAQASLVDDMLEEGRTVALYQDKQFGVCVGAIGYAPLTSKANRDLEIARTAAITELSGFIEGRNVSASERSVFSSIDGKVRDAFMSEARTNIKAYLRAVEVVQSGKFGRERYAFARGKCVLTAWCKDIFETAGISPRIRYERQWVTNDYSCFRSVGVSFAWRFGGYQEKKREGVDTSRFK